MTENISLDAIDEKDLNILMAYGDEIVKNNTVELTEAIRAVVDQRYSGVYSCAA